MKNSANFNCLSLEKYKELTSQADLPEDHERDRSDKEHMYKYDGCVYVCNIFNLGYISEAST